MTKNQRAAEDLLADLNDLPDDPNAAPGDAADADEASINEFLAEFSKDRERPSRPATPRLPGSKPRASPRLSIPAEHAKSRRSVELPRASTESKRSNKDDAQTFTNSSAANSDRSEKNEETESVKSEAAETSQKKIYGSSNSWSSWGGSLWSTANQLQTQIRAEAEKRLADLQASEEAQKIQARLRELDLSRIASEARNIGQGVLDAVAPPIEDNETLIVNVTHDLVGLKVEKSVYSSFERVMEQVEGGSLQVVAKDRTGSLEVNSITETADAAKKMNLAAIEDTIRDNAIETADRTSNVYLSIQAYTELPESVSEKGKEKESDEDDGDEQAVQILVTLHDPANSIRFSSTSQSFPSSWIELSLRTVDAATQPRDWITEWLEEAIQLCFGILAQRYVARRMGLDKSGDNSAQSHQNKDSGLKVREGQDLSEAGLGL